MSTYCVHALDKCGRRTSNISVANNDCAVWRVNVQDLFGSKERQGGCCDPKRHRENSAGADANFVFPEAYTTEGDLFKKRTIKLGNKLIIWLERSKKPQQMISSTKITKSRKITLLL